MPTSLTSRHDDGWRRNFGWLESFWRDVIRAVAGRCWRVFTLIDGELWLRDGEALALVKERLANRSDVQRHCVRAWITSTEPLAPPEVDVLMIGRPKTYYGSSLAPLARLLEGGMRGKFLDPPTGRPGNAIAYGDRRFTQHELASSTADRRRCDVDYAVLLYRRGSDGDQARHMVAVAGLSTLGTLGLAYILTDDVRRRRFLDQVRQVATWEDGLHPEEAFEVCVRISVGSEERLDNFLNNPDFLFQVVAVAVAGGKVWVSEPTVELMPDPDGGGTVRLEGLGDARLSAPLFALVRQLVEHPERTTAAELCSDLGVKENALHQRVHDSNRSFRKQMPTLGDTRVIRYDRKVGRYVIAIKR